VINAQYVERSLLGTLLNDPTRRTDVPWVQVSDFTNPLCRALWAHLEKGSPPHFTHPIDYVSLSDVLRAETDLHPRLTSPSQIAALQVHAPADPHAAAYGRILVEVAIRNQILAIGLKLGSEAERHPPQKRASPSAAIEALEGLTNRWQHAGPPNPMSPVGDSRSATEQGSRDGTGQSGGGRGGGEPSNPEASCTRTDLRAAGPRRQLLPESLGQATAASKPSSCRVRVLPRLRRGLGGRPWPDAP